MYRSSKLGGLLPPKSETWGNFPEISHSIPRLDWIDAILCRLGTDIVEVAKIAQVTHQWHKISFWGGQPNSLANPHQSVCMKTQTTIIANIPRVCTCCADKMPQGHCFCWWPAAFQGSGPAYPRLASRSNGHHGSQNCTQGWGKAGQKLGEIRLSIGLFSLRHMEPPPSKNPIHWESSRARDESSKKNFEPPTTKRFVDFWLNFTQLPEPAYDSIVSWRKPWVPWVGCGRGTSNLLNRSQNTDPTDEMRSHDIKRTQMMQTTGWPHSGLKNMVLNCLIQMDSIWFKLRRVLELHLLSFIEVHVSMFLCRSIRIFTLIHTSSTVVQVSKLSIYASESAPDVSSYLQCCEDWVDALIFPKWPFPVMTEYGLVQR